MAHSEPTASRLLAPLHRLTRMSRSDRADAAMLALPVVLVALTIAVSQWANGVHRSGLPFASQLTDGAHRALVGLPREAQALTPLAPRGDNVRIPAVPILLVASATPGVEKRIAAVPAGAEPARMGLPPATALAPASAPGETAVIARAGQTAHAAAPSRRQVAAEALPQDPVRLARSEPGEPVIPSSDPPPERPPPDAGPEHTVAVRTPPPAMLGIGDGETQCRAPEEEPLTTPALRDWDGSDTEAFGVALARAARDQLDDFVIYNDRYRRIGYPMGDVHPMYGVCTDVVIRAYRALGIDLQVLVKTTKSGSGDANIDHRRVDTLRKFFTRFGDVLPISNFAEDYRPGDIVTYWRPQNRHSRTHIAVVSDVSGPSGRPLIIHNRGWGPQQEDGLFVDKITGHFRFAGLKAAPAATGSIGTKAALKRVSSRGVGRTAPVMRAGLTMAPGDGVAAPQRSPAQP